jgi:ComF family protein
MDLLSLFLDLVAPPTCFVCHRRRVAADPPLCRPCFLELPWWRRADGCPKCGFALFSKSKGFADSSSDPCADSGGQAGSHDEPTGCPNCLATGSGLHLCRAALRYSGEVRLWVPALKNSRGPFGPSVEVQNAIRFLAQTLAAQISAETRARPDLVVPIPLHPRRQRQRGFNHADVIASHIARGLGRPWHPRLLERIRATTPQAHLVGDARRRNTRGAFRVRNGLADARQIWLVDDVLTTGNTLEAAADALIDAGAEEVRALTLAATLPSARPRQTPRAKAESSAYHPAALGSEKPF